MTEDRSLQPSQKYCNCAQHPPNLRTSGASLAPLHSSSQSPIRLGRGFPFHNHLEIWNALRVVRPGLRLVRQVGLDGKTFTSRNVDGAARRLQKNEPFAIYSSHSKNTKGRTTGPAFSHSSTKRRHRNNRRLTRPQGSRFPRPHQSPVLGTSPDQPPRRFSRAESRRSGVRRPSARTFLAPRSVPPPNSSRPQKSQRAGFGARISRFRNCVRSRSPKSGITASRRRI